MYSFWGKILVVDLSRKTVEVLEKDAAYCRKYMGGALLCARLFEELGGQKTSDALAPENPLIFAPGPLAGQRVCGATRVNVLSCSPESGSLYLSQAGGEFGPAIKRAGVDALAVVFAGLGLEIDRFGASSVAVSAAPAGLTAGQVEAMVRDLLAADELTAAGTEDRRMEVAAKRAACAAAVKARAGLDPSEVVQLLDDLEELRNPSHCPHGRPLIRRLARWEIEALFHRK